MAAAEEQQWANLIPVPVEQLETGKTYWVTNLGRDGNYRRLDIKPSQMYEVNLKSISDLTGKPARPGAYQLTNMKLIVPREGNPTQWKVEPLKGFHSTYIPYGWNMHTEDDVPKFYEPPEKRSVASKLSVASVVRQKATAGHPIGVRGVASIKSMVGGGRRTRRRRRSIKRKRKRRSRRRKR